jgi:hypothetical protein
MIITKTIIEKHKRKKNLFITSLMNLLNLLWLEDLKTC